MVGFLESWGSSALASIAVPLPFPTKVFFAAARASHYSTRRFLAVVTVCRSARYARIAIIADSYGRQFVQVLRHPSQYWGWLLLFAAAIRMLVLNGILPNRRLAPATSLRPAGSKAMAAFPHP
jgi:hypothetical protein